jgi:hypothetical protein
MTMAVQCDICFLKLKLMAKCVKIEDFLFILGKRHFALLENIFQCILFLYKPFYRCRNLDPVLNKHLFSD